METVIDYLLKSAGVLSIFVLVYHFLLRRLTFFNTNRWFLLSGIAASILFPLIEITQTVYIEQPEQLEQITYLPQQLATPMAMLLQDAPVEVSEPFNYGMLALYMYLSIGLFFLGKMIVELSSLRNLIRSGSRKKSGRFVVVTLSRKLTPFSFFNYICYSDSDQQSPELDLILDHEKVHAREWHSIDLLVSHIFRAVFWINPLVWLLKRQIGENLEFIADSKAKTQNTSGISYERTLLSTAASHMQPALANNFFTPFIKKRIVMLQKEASTKWNAYKYALILPVIVLFLYSFNVVEKIEYVEKDALENTNNSIDTIKELVFDITSATTDTQLEAYRKQIETQVDYKLKFDDLDRGVNNLLETMSVSAKFPGKEWVKGFTINPASEDLILLMADSNEISVHLPKDNTTLSIDKSGTNILKPDVVLAGNIPSSIDINENIVLPEDHTISFTIDATSTKEYLKEKKTFLKKQYNVDFDYSKLKIKNGRIVRIKITLDDNKGYKGSQAYSAADGITSICVNGVVKGGSKSWSMGDCKATVASTSPHNISYVVSGNTLNMDMDSLMNAVKTEVKFMSMDSIQNLNTFQFQNINLDSLQNELQYQFKNVNMDSILNIAQLQFNNVNIDSLQKEVQIQLNNINMDSLQNFIKVIHLNDAQIKYTFKNDDSLRITSQSGINSFGIENNDKKPLYIINGVQATDEQLQLINPQSIKSVSVLKNAQATTLYGDKGKDGVLIITTKPNAFTDLKNARTKADTLRAKMEIKRQALLHERQEKRSPYQIRRDSLMGKKAEKMEEKRAQREQKKSEYELRRAQLESKISTASKGVSQNSGYVYNNGTYFYVSKNNETQFFDRWGKKRFFMDKSYNGDNDFSGKVTMDGKRFNIKIKDSYFTLNDNQGKVISIRGLTDRQVEEYNAQGKWTDLNELTELQIDEFNQGGKTTLFIESDYHTDDMSKKQFESLKKYVEDAGHTFKLRTHRMKGKRLVKLKFEINGAQYSYQANKGVKELYIKFKGESVAPSISMIPFE